MAVIPISDLETALRTALGESPDDNGLTLIENLHDTLEDLHGVEGGVNWKQRYEENDASWRKKYADRFNAPVDNDDEGKNKPAPGKGKNYSDLFKEVK